MLPLLPLLVLIGCTPTPSETGTGGVETGQDVSSDSGEQGGDSDGGPLAIAVPSPLLDAEGVGEALEAALSGGLPNHIEAREAYMARFEGRDGGCPGGNGYSLPGNFEGCEADSGFIYGGLSEYTGPDDPGDRTRDFHLLGDGFITDPDGNRFILAGELDFVPEGNQWTGSITGTWSWPLAEGWMAPELGGGVLELDLRRLVEGWEVEVSGSIGGQAWPLTLTEVSASSDICDGEPTGTFSLRGTQGYWYEFVRREGECTCGTVTYADGSELGEACPVLRSAFEWVAAEQWSSSMAAGEP